MNIVRYWDIFVCILIITILDSNAHGNNDYNEYLSEALGEVNNNKISLTNNILLKNDTYLNLQQISSDYNNTAKNTALEVSQPSNQIKINNLTNLDNSIRESSTSDINIGNNELEVSDEISNYLIKEKEYSDNFESGSLAHAYFQSADFENSRLQLKEPLEILDKTEINQLSDYIPTNFTSTNITSMANKQEVEESYKDEEDIEQPYLYGDSAYTLDQSYFKSEFMDNNNQAETDYDSSNILEDTTQLSKQTPFKSFTDLQNKFNAEISKDTDLLLYKDQSKLDSDHLESDEEKADKLEIKDHVQNIENEINISLPLDKNNPPNSEPIYPEMKEEGQKNQDQTNYDLPLDTELEQKTEYSKNFINNLTIGNATIDIPPQNIKSMNTTLLDNTPMDITHLNNTPMDTTPQDDTPMDTTPQDDTPMDTTPQDDTPMDTTPLDNTPMYTTLDNTPMYTTFKDYNQMRTKLDYIESMDTTLGDNTPMDITPRDNITLGTNSNYIGAIDTTSRDDTVIDTNSNYIEPIDTNLLDDTIIDTNSNYIEPIDTNPVDDTVIDTNPIYTEAVDTTYKDDLVISEPIESRSIESESYIEEGQSEIIEDLSNTSENKQFNSQDITKKSVMSKQIPIIIVDSNKQTTIYPENFILNKKMPSRTKSHRNRKISNLRNKLRPETISSLKISIKLLTQFMISKRHSENTKSKALKKLVKSLQTKYLEILLIIINEEINSRKSFDHAYKTLTKNSLENKPLLSKKWLNREKKRRNNQKNKRKT